MREEVTWMVATALIALAGIALWKVVAGGPLSGVPAVRRFDELISTPAAAPAAAPTGR